MFYWKTQNQYCLCAKSTILGLPLLIIVELGMNTSLLGDVLEEPWTALISSCTRRAAWIRQRSTIHAARSCCGVRRKQRHPWRELQLFPGCCWLCMVWSGPCWHSPCCLSCRFTPSSPCGWWLATDREFLDRTNINQTLIWKLLKYLLFTLQDLGRIKSILLAGQIDLRGNIRSTPTGKQELK